MLNRRVERTLEAALWLTLICGSDRSSGASRYELRVSWVRLLNSLSLSSSTWRTQVSNHIPTLWSEQTNNKFLQLTLTLAIEVTTLFSFFSLARHNPLMVHSTRTS